MLNPRTGVGALLLGAALAALGILPFGWFKWIKAKWLQEDMLGLVAKQTFVMIQNTCKWYIYHHHLLPPTYYLLTTLKSRLFTTYVGK